MSRSYKKNRYFKDRTPGMKKNYNRKLRRTNKDNYDIPNNNYYRKMNESWNISDFKIDYNYNFETYKKDYLEFFDNEFECYKYWRNKICSK